MASNKQPDAPMGTPLLSGTKLGRYEIRSKIGAGGMGEVYLAQDTQLERTVALKVLPADVVDDKQRMRRFTQEAKTASALNHPNILTIYEIGQVDTTHFIATEFIEGETLRQHMRGARMKLSEVLNIAVQTADALAAAHEAGIIHRDIKPENIMLRRRDAYVKVLDFGLAKLTEPQPAVVDTEAPTKTLFKTEEGVVMGTVTYMSPEQARGLEVDERTDIWSLGVVLYEMVAGCLPFAGSTASEILVAIINEKEPPPLARFAREVPAELERIVTKALRKDREQRYQGIKDLLLDLRELKQELEFEAKLERSKPPDLSSAPAPALSGRQAMIDTAQEPTAQTGEIAALSTTSTAKYLIGKISQHKRVAVLVLAVLVIAAVAAFLLTRGTPALTEKDTILLADFVNTTGDAVFDGTLKQALAVQLGQSPFLNIFPDDRIRETLRYMNRSPDERVTNQVAREICERQGIKAMLTGSIASLGSHYVITLEALNGHTGDALAREQVEADSKEQVISKLGEAATKLREKLGESLVSIQKFDTPLAEATTSSLEALRASTLGRELANRGKHEEAIPFLKRAVELDPKFALAYVGLATYYSATADGYSSNEPNSSGVAEQYAAKAFELRERVTERERFYISSLYYELVTKDLDKGIEVMELWSQTYPRDYLVRNNLAFAYVRVGQYEKAVEQASEGIRLNPNVAVLYSNLGWAYRALGRYDEAKATFEQAHSRNLDYLMMHWNAYLIAFAEGDRAEMQRQLEWASGKLSEPSFLIWQSGTEKFAGRYRQSHEAARRAVESAQSLGFTTSVAHFISAAATWNALVGNCQHARAETAKALAIARGAEPPNNAVLALALCGEVGRAQSFIDDLARNPTSTERHAIYLPVIRAAIEIGRGNQAEAIRLLQKAKRYEMGHDAEFLPIYMRGQAYLRQGSATEALAEFQKIIDHRSVSPAHILYPLAYLGLARAAALAGDTAKSQKAYQDFFALWKDADTDIPILIEAKKEYEKLK